MNAGDLMNACGRNEGDAGFVRPGAWPWVATLLLPAIVAAAPEAAVETSPSPEALESAQSLVKLLWAVLLLVMIFVAGLFVLRSLRRTRQRLTRARAEPTQWSDAWQMHRLPEDDGAGSDEESLS